jgi:ABC-type multidrug transport system ATPase subunit
LVLAGQSLSPAAMPGKGSNVQTQVLVNVRKYYDIKWKGNPGLWKLCPFCFQMIFPCIFMGINMFFWDPEDLVMEEFNQTFEHFAAKPQPTMFNPFPMACNGLDFSLFGGLEGSLFQPPPFKQFLQDLQCGGAKDYDECLEEGMGGGLFYMFTLQGIWMSQISEILEADPSFDWSPQTLAITGEDSKLLDEVKKKLNDVADEGIKPIQEGFDRLNKCPPTSAACRRSWIRLSAYLQTALGGWEPRNADDSQCSPLEDIAKIMGGTQPSTVQDWEATTIDISAEDQQMAGKVMEVGKEYLMDMVVPLLQMTVAMMSMSGGGMGGGFGAGGGVDGNGSRRLQWGGGWGGGSSCPLEAKKPEDDSADDSSTELEDFIDGVLPWLRAQIKKCGCANLMTFVDPNLPGCMCESKVANCTTFGNLMTDLDVEDDLGRNAVILGLPFLVDQMSGGFGRRATFLEEPEALSGLRLRAAEEERARIEKQRQKDEDLLSFIAAAKEQHAEREARLQGREETSGWQTLKSRAKSAAKSAILQAVKANKYKKPARRSLQSTDQFGRRLSEVVKCDDLNDDPCACGDTDGSCEYDDQDCNEGKLGSCKDQDEGGLGSGFAALFGRGKHGRLTSCMECPTKPGCGHAVLWGRLEKGIKGLKPDVKTYDSRDEVDAVVQMEGYQWGDAAYMGIEKGATPFCAALHLGASAGTNVEVQIQLNASSALAGDLNLLDSTFKWTQSAQHRRYNSYMTGGPSSFIAFQKFFEQFTFEKAGMEDATDPYFVPLPTDGRKRLGIAVWFPERIPAFVGDMHFSAYLIGIAFALTVFRERILHIRDGLQMMGLPDSGYYLSVFVFYGSWIMIPTIGAGAFMKHPPPFVLDRGDSGIEPWGTPYEGSTFVYIWWMYWFHVMTVFLHCLIFTCCTDRRPVLIILSYVFTDFSTVIPSQVLGPTTDWWLRWTVALLLPVASFTQSMGAFRELLLLGTPLTWDTLFIRIHDEGAWSVGDGCIMLPIAVLFYTFVYVYLDQVLAAPTTRPWHWPVTILFEKAEKVELVVGSTGNPKFFEEIDTQHQEMERNNQCVMVRDFVKTFQAHGLTTYAVQGLSLTLYEGEIFCLLGHNGAGKTTAINCLTGILTPSSGTASAFGMPLKEFRTKYRKDVGFCPQHSVLWTELTCLQHLVIFARLKGFDKRTAIAESEDVLEQLGMMRKAHTQAKALSGGMQRKLSLGIAFVCKPRLVFLDEPSSGMDATARQECWDFLRSRREKTVILLTTHYMDEADCLGDRVMVMSAGKANCCGSGQFLKAAFNCGYMIRCLLPEGVTDEKSKDGVVQVVEKFLGGPVSGRSGTGGELNLTVRMDQAGTFATMFPELDNLIKAGNLKEWSIAVCSLEEVFLRVASGWAGEGEVHEEKAAVKLPETKRGVVKNGLQIMALFKRRAQYMKRSWLYLILQTLFPAFYILLIFVIIGGFFGQIFSSADLPVGMDKYNEQLRLETPDMPEVLPVLAIPVGLEGDAAGSLGSHGLADSFSVGDIKYELKTITMTLDEYGAECDDDDNLDMQWIKEDLERNETREKEEEEEKTREDNPGECEDEGRRGGRPKDSRRLSLRSLLSRYKKGESGPLAGCELGDGGKYLKTADGSKNISDVEVVARGFSCWLRKDRLREGRPESTYGAIMLYGLNGSEVLLVNTSGIHTVPIMQNVRANALLQKLDASHEIRVVFSVFERTPMELGNLQTSILTIVAIILLGVAFFLPPPFYVAFIVEEKALGVKGQMLVSGVRGINYWVANYVFDLLPWTFAMGTVTLCFWAYELEFFFGEEVFPVYVAICFAFVVHQVPFAYCLGQLYSEPSSAIISVPILNFIFIILYFIWSFQMGNPLENSYAGTAQALTPLLRMHPIFCLSESMNLLYQLDSRFQVQPPEELEEADKEICRQAREAGENARWSCAESFWDWDACGGAIYTSIGYGFIMMFLVMGLEVLAQTPSFVFWYQTLFDAKQKPTITPDEEDDAVRAEAQKVTSGGKTGPIEVKTVRKSYVVGKGHLHAVKDISWACDAGDVFGLLGVNGAGKTTMFQMLSGITVQNEGGVQIAGQNILTSGGLKRARNVIGYCPQHNPLIPILTVREHVEMYGMIKGLSGKDLESARDLWVQAMDLKSHQWKLAGNLSGGNKRKLCVALAMIGDPEVILLDEPSAGMDPEARRFMWNVIAEIAQTRKQATVVLTTHSMEECEALCNKITIMVNGSFRCIGTHKEVKELYGQGRELSLKLKVPTKDEVSQLQSRWSAENVLAVAPARRTSTAATQGGGSKDAPVSATLTRAALAAWADGQDPFLAQAVRSAIAPFPDSSPESIASAAVIGEWYLNATNAKLVLEWVKQLDISAEWLAWASTTFRFKLYGGGSLPTLFDNMYKNKERLKMTEYAVMPTSLEQIFHAFAKEQTGATEDQGVYSNDKEKALAALFQSIQAAGSEVSPMSPVSKGSGDVEV